MECRVYRYIPHTDKLLTHHSAITPSLLQNFILHLYTVLLVLLSYTLLLFLCFSPLYYYSLYATTPFATSTLMLLSIMLLLPWCFFPLGFFSPYVSLPGVISPLVLLFPFCFLPLYPTLLLVLLYLTACYFSPLCFFPSYCFFRLLLSLAAFLS